MISRYKHRRERRKERAFFSVTIFLALYSFHDLIRNFEHHTSTLQMHIISIIICRTFLVFVKVAPSAVRRTVGETREILIINSMKLCQIEIKLRSNRFSRAIVRSRWVRRTFVRERSFVRVCHATGSISGCYHARHIETKLWTRTDCRIRILRYNGLIMKPSNICRSRRTCNFDRDRRNIQKFLAKNSSWNVPVLITTGKNTIKYHNAKNSFRPPIMWDEAIIGP